MHKQHWSFKKLTGHQLLFGEILQKLNEIIVCGNSSKNMETNANQITKLIWLGNASAAHDFNFIYRNKIRHIINLTPNIPNKFSFIQYHRYPVKDYEACLVDLYELMDNAADTIHKAMLENSAVLVHCKNGHHRSAAVVALYLMKYHNMTLIDAISYIKKIRPTTFQRMNCMLKTLLRYEFTKLNSIF